MQVPPICIAWESNGTANYLTKVTALTKHLGIVLESAYLRSGDILAVGADASDPDGMSNAGSAYLYRLKAMVPPLT